MTGPDGTAIDILRDLIRIRSCDNDETEIVAYLERRLSAKGASCTVMCEHGRPLNLVAQVGQGTRSLLLNAHMDTVAVGNLTSWDADPLDPVERHGRIYGRGACDDKGSLAAMVAAFEAKLEDRAWQERGRIIFAAVGGEERGGVGTKLLIQEGMRADAAVVGECTNLEPMIAHKGVLRLEVITRGVLAHASEPEEGINAIDAMAPLIIRLNELSRKVEKRQDLLCGHATLNITTIHGGVALNVVPDQCLISIDRRLIPSETEEDAWSEIEAALNEVAALEGINFDLRRVRCLLPAHTSQEERIVEVSIAALRHRLGRAVYPAGFPATCDMTFLVNDANIPTVVLGPGSLDVAHKANEWVDMGQVQTAALVYADIVDDWFDV